MMLDRHTDQTEHLSADARRLLAQVGRRAPRVQCLTNTVAQALSANVLLAVGADVSMALHPAELPEMAASAGALLINLGTLDPLREAAIDVLISDRERITAPVVVDPVLAHRSPLRATLAERLIATFPGVVLKGNGAEMANFSHDLPAGTVRVTTGRINEVETAGIPEPVRGGHHFMSCVTGMGCALGAFIAAFAAIEQDRAAAARAALECYGLAGHIAGKTAPGPGSFEPLFVDALWRLARAVRGDDDAH